MVMGAGVVGKVVSSVVAVEVLRTGSGRVVVLIGGRGVR